MEGGSSITGEQTNCDLTCYVKKEANHVGPTLEARFYTLEMLCIMYYFWCVPSTRRMRRSLLSMLSPLPTGVVARRMRWRLLRLMPAPSPMRAVAHRTRRKKLLLPPFTPRPYYLGYRDYIIILFGIYMSFSRFQYELLVHTPNTDVYRRILECRFTHFAPYVA